MWRGGLEPAPEWPHNRCANCHTRTLYAILESQSFMAGFTPSTTFSMSYSHILPPPCERYEQRLVTPFVWLIAFCETFNLSPLRVRPKECHALQPEHSGSGRMQLAYTGASEYIDQVWHDGQQVTAQATMPLNIPASNQRIDHIR